MRWGGGGGRWAVYTGSNERRGDGSGREMSSSVVKDVEVPPTCRGLSLSLPVSNLHFTGAEEGAGLLAHSTQPLLTCPVY